MPEPTSTQSNNVNNDVSGVATQPQSADTTDIQNTNDNANSAKDNTQQTDTANNTKVDEKSNQEPFSVDYGNFGLGNEVQLESDVTGILKEFGLKHKVSSEDMNSFVKKYVDFAKSKEEKNQADFENIKKGWEQTNTDKYKTEVEKVYTKTDNFLNSKETGKALKSFLSENDISKHPAVVNFLYEISKDYSEDNTIRPTTTGDTKEKDPYSILYPDDAV